jgi:hypothetical protein
MADVGVTGFIGVILVVVINREARRDPMAAAGMRQQ